MARPKVAVVILGGTFFQHGSDPRDPTEYSIASSIDIPKLMALVTPFIDVDIQWDEFSNEDSTNTRFKTRWDVSNRVTSYTLRSDIYGVVVIGGSDLQEEMSFFVDCTTNTRKAIVFVSAIRPSTAAFPDGPMNLIHGLSLAIHDKSRGRDALVVSGEEFFLARYAIKVNANKVSAFEAPVSGPLGTFVGFEPRFNTTPARPFPDYYHDIFMLTCPEMIPDVAIVQATQEHSVKRFQEAIYPGVPTHSGADAIVLDASASGYVSELLEEAIEEENMRRKTQGEEDLIIVVVTSARGFCKPHNIKGAISAGFLSPRKAATLMTLLMVLHSSKERIQCIFEGRMPQKSKL